MIKVAIVENEPYLAAILAQLLDDCPQTTCVGVCTNSSDALAAIPHWQPDVVLMDIDLGQGINGIGCIMRLRPTCPNTRFVVLTIFEDHQHVFDALSAGAMGYILKTDAPHRIIAAIEDVYEGGAPITPSIARRLLERLHISPPTLHTQTPEPVLTRREVEVIELIAKGKMEKEVATDLFISFKTVKTHISNIYQKLQVNTRVEALNKYYGTYSITG
jgi:two-component system, NarL family, response regulator LiaR